LTIGSRQLLETVAAQAEGIIELILSAEQLRVRDRLERDAELAMAVQRNLIPGDSPIIPTVQVATRYRPALQLSGDLFDCVLRADGRLVIAVADVSGKGTAAALVMAAARMSVRGAAFRGSANDAATMMTRVSEDLYDDLGNMNRFMTIFLGVINPVLGQIVMANAGHSPVILASGKRPAYLLEADSPPIGVLPVFEFENRQIPLASGDILLVATDGFPEAAAPNGELFGYERMLRLVDDMKEQSAEEIADALVSAVDSFADGTEQSDDQALVIVKRQVA
jgi:sigma-B regulation protein RsbU (phosphoserine phosphatase)